MNALAFQKFDDLVARHQSFVHVTHVNPDADGLGSALAVSRWLRSLGKTCRVVVPSAVPRRLRYLVEDGEIDVVTETDPEFVLGDDTVLILYDVSTLSRLGALEQPLQRTTQPRVVFDHHDGEIEFEAIAFVDEGAGATAQVVYEMLAARGVQLGQELALPLYVAILADTGSFNYGKTTPRTHEIAAALLAAGVDPLDVHGRMEGTRSIDSVRALGSVLASLCIDDADDRVAHAELSRTLLHSGGREPLDAGDLVNHTISIEGVLAGVLFIEVSDTVTRLSLRSKGPVSIVEVAAAFGGGGHRNAAGATVNGPLQTVRPRVLSKLREAVAAQCGAIGTRNTANG